MKLLDLPALTVLRQAAEASGDLSLHLSCYSLKSTTSDTKLAKQLASALEEERNTRRQRAVSFSSVMSGAPALDDGDEGAGVAALASGGAHAGGNLDVLRLENNATARRTLFWLISLLNAAFPDYDYRCAR